MRVSSRMNSREMLAITDRYAALLESNGAVPRRVDVERNFRLPADRMVLLNHARWQLEMVRRVVHRLGGESTAIRLFGSAQGLMVAAGLLTVAETWRENAQWLDGASVRAFDTAIQELDQEPSRADCT